MKYWNIVILHILFSVRPLPNTNAPLQPAVASCWWCCHNNRTPTGVFNGWFTWGLAAEVAPNCKSNMAGVEEEHFCRIVSGLRDIKKSKVCCKRVCYSFFLDCLSLLKYTMKWAQPFMNMKAGLCGIYFNQAMRSVFVASVVVLWDAAVLD